MSKAAEGGATYRQILKSSSIIGGAQGIVFLLGLVKTKTVALLLGPSGVGLVGLFQSVIALLAIVGGLGISSSGVKEVAEANSSEDPLRVARAVRVLRRMCWATGAMAWAMTALLAWPLSVWTFGSGDHAIEIAVLGSALLFGAISGGQSAALQGFRRIGHLALINILSAAGGTLLAIGLYAWLGKQGIVPVLILTAVVNLGCSWWFAKKIQISEIQLTSGATWHLSKRLIGLGLAFTWSALLVSAAALVVRALIVRDSGLDGNGIYQASWGISGMFAGFILSAMGADFFPRLTAVAHDSANLNRLVNEQTEIGILLALPGLLGTLAFAPLLMELLYTSQFVSGAKLLPWFVLGVFGRIISWPMGFVLLAKGAARWFVVTETLSNLVYVILVVVLLRLLGLQGAAVAFTGLYILYTIGIFFVVRRITKFSWSSDVLKLLVISSAMIIAGFAVESWFHGLSSWVLGGFLTLGGAVLSLRGLALRLGDDYGPVRLACRIPGVRRLLGLIE